MTLNSSGISGAEIVSVADKTSVILGACHCRNLTFRLTASRPPEDLPVRACGCRFCRQHAALSTSDPDGRVSFGSADPARVARYRFGLKTADFLICRDCGVYVGALMVDGDEAFAILNVNACDEAERFSKDTTTMDYGAEDVAARTTRRRAKWTPANPQIETTQ